MESGRKVGPVENMMTTDSNDCETGYKCNRSRIDNIIDGNHQLMNGGHVLVINALINYMDDSNKRMIKEIFGEVQRVKEEINRRVDKLVVDFNERSVQSQCRLRQEVSADFHHLRGHIERMMSEEFAEKLATIIVSLADRSMSQRPVDRSMGQRPAGRESLTPSPVKFAASCKAARDGTSSPSSVASPAALVIDESPTPPVSGQSINCQAMNGSSVMLTTAATIFTDEMKKAMDAFVVKLATTGVPAPDANGRPSEGHSAIPSGHSDNNRLAAAFANATRPTAKRPTDLRATDLRATDLNGNDVEAAKGPNGDTTKRKRYSTDSCTTKLTSPDVAGHPADLKRLGGGEELLESHQHYFKVRQNNRTVYRCKGCPRVSHNSVYISDHFKSAHLGIKNNYMCNYCGQVFGLKITAYIHAKKHTTTHPTKLISTLLE